MTILEENLSTMAPNNILSPLCKLKNTLLLLSQPHVIYINKISRKKLSTRSKMIFKTKSIITQIILKKRSGVCHKQGQNPRKDRQ